MTELQVLLQIAEDTTKQIPTPSLINSLKAHFKPNQHDKLLQVLSFLEKHSENILKKESQGDHTCKQIHSLTYQLFNSPSIITLDNLIPHIKRYLSNSRLQGY